MNAAQILTNGVVQVLLGLIGLAGVLTVGYWQFGRPAREAKQTLGDPPSPDVTVISLLQDVITGQASQDSRLAKHDTKLAEHEAEIAEHRRKLIEHAEAIRKLQQDGVE